MELDEQSLTIRKTEIERNLDNQTVEYTSYEFIEQVLNNFEAALKNALPEKQKSLLQLIIKDISVTKDKKIDKINLKFDEDIQKYFLNAKAGESSTIGILHSFQRITKKVIRYL